MRGYSCQFSLAAAIVSCTNSRENETKGMLKCISKEAMLKIAELWRPYRTIASIILWHSYIKI